MAGHNLLPESFVLQELEEVKADRILEKTHISRLLKEEIRNRYTIVQSSSGFLKPSSMSGSSGS